jgi:2-(1,2-epoxy-1,2-dihydrophenyl)acetyl-CoA isomerase
LTLRLFELPKPTIAALPGAVAGAGMSIALACDIRIGSETAFYTPGFGAVGLSGDYGGSWQLTQLVGPAKAKEIYFTGRRVQADEALSLGLLNEVVEGDVMTRARELARQIANGPPQAISYMKQNINRAAQADFKTCLDWEADRLVRVAQTDDHKEAVCAFIEKRAPVFKGT